MEHTMRTIVIASAAALIATCSMAAAQTAAEKPKKEPKPQSEASIACSKQADDKGLHGKERKAFRAKCKKEFKKAG
jgi:hypothetical protein